MTSPYKTFGTEKALEAEKGVKLEYDGFSISILRAGGENRSYARVLEAKMRPHRRKIQAGTLDPKLNVRLLAEVYAETIVIGWDGLNGKDDKPLAFNRDNCVQLLTDLPDLFQDIVSQATDMRVFQLEAAEADAKN